MVANPSMSPETATAVLWVVWYTTWILAAVWSAKTRVQMRTDMAGLHRLLLTLGLVLILVPSDAARSSSEFFMLPLWQSSVWTKWALFVFVVASFAFCWWARLHLGRLWSGFVTLKEGHRVVDTGPYALVRHPIYTGIISAAAATALMKATPLAFGGFAMITIGLAMTAKIEERFLREQLGEAYDVYRKRVAMLVPMVR